MNIINFFFISVLNNVFYLLSVLYFYSFCNLIFIILLFVIFYSFIFFNFFTYTKFLLSYKKNFFFFKKKNNFIILFIFNFYLFIYFILFYLNNMFFNNFNYIFIIFKKKINFIYFNLDWLVQIDYINLYFIILTVFIFFIIYFTLFNTKFKNDLNNKNLKAVFSLFFFIEIVLILTFSTSNIFFFFFFFECSLIPMYLLIILLGKGLKKKHYASISLVFFTLTGSIFLLFAILYLIVISNSCDFKHLNYELIDFNSQLFLFLCFFLGFSVKVPIFPFYSWLPEAHVEASTSISILLAAIFLKIATYGMLKIMVLNLFIATFYYYSIIFYFSLISIILASFLILFQIDLKKIVALSSVIHMNYIVISLFSLEPKAIVSGFIYMFSHAFVSSALFFLIGILYENNGTRDLLNFNGLIKYNSKFFFFFFFFNLANISFPLTLSFISELILLNNLIYLNIIIIVIFLMSIFLSVIYTFWMLHNIFFGKVFIKKNSFFLNKFDLNFLILMFLIVFVLGIIPNTLLFNFEQEIYLNLIKKINIY